jgi:hypothetical protein
MFYEAVYLKRGLSRFAAFNKWLALGSPGCYSY